MGSLEIFSVLYLVGPEKERERGEERKAERKRDLYEKEVWLKSTGLVDFITHQIKQISMK